LKNNGKYWKILKNIEKIMKKNIEKILKNIEKYLKYWKILKYIEKCWKNIEKYWKILKKYWRVLILNVLKVVRQILQKYHRYIVEHIFSIFYPSNFSEGSLVRVSIFHRFKKNKRALSVVLRSRSTKRRYSIVDLLINLSFSLFLSRNVLSANY
jgi:hypothetical protein